MILTTLLILILIGLIVFSVVVLTIGGTLGIIIFSDVIVCVLVLVFIIRKIFKRRH